MREHERFLGAFVQQFRNHDTDRDGVVDEQQFRALIETFGIVEKESVERFL